MKRRLMKVERVLSRKALRAAQLDLMQAEAMTFGGVPEDWAPFGEEFFVMPLPADLGDESDDEEGGDEPPALAFSHFSAKVDGRPTYTRHFSSVKDFCEQPFARKENEALFLDEEFEGGKWDDMDDRKLRGLPTTFGNIDWYDAPTGEEAARRAFHGWPEGAERVRRMMAEMDAPPPVSLRRKVQRADQGDALDIHAVYRGGLDRAWERRRREHSRARMSVRLVAQIGGSKHTSAESLFWRGAAVTKLAEMLEESGYRVEVVGFEWHDSDEGEHQFYTRNTFVVKDAGAPLDVEQVAGVLCNAGFPRTYGFRSAYCAAEHVIREATHEPQWQLSMQKVGRKWSPVRVPKINPRTGKQLVSRKRLLARTSHVNHATAPQELGLCDDGTQTFAVPALIGSLEAAQEWVNKCLKELEQQNTQ